jgi:hypothetical protein
MTEIAYLNDRTTLFWWLGGAIAPFYDPVIQVECLRECVSRFSDATTEMISMVRVVLPDWGRFPHIQIVLILK